MRILLDEGAKNLQPRLEMLGHQVLTHGIGRSDRALVNWATKDGLVIVTVDRDFVRLWRATGCRCRILYSARGPQNAKWPDLLPEALEWLAGLDRWRDGIMGGLVEIRDNKIRRYRADGIPA